jgi:hypothetical protein
MRHLDPGENLEQLRGQMHRGAGADRGVVELARLALGEIDQLAHGVGREATPRDQVLRRHECQRNRLEIPHRIIGQLFLDARIDGEAGHAAEKDRRPVGLGIGGEARADHLGCARLVVDNEALAGLLRQHVGHGARQNVSDAAGGIGYDDGDDPVVLRRRGRHRQSGRQRRHGKGAAKRGAVHVDGKVHGEFRQAICSRAVLDLNFLDRLAAMIVGTSNPPH